MYCSKWSILNIITTIIHVTNTIIYIPLFMYIHVHIVCRVTEDQNARYTAIFFLKKS